MLDRLLVVIGIGALGLVCVIAVGNLDTLEHLGHVSGSLSALAQRASEGTLYPPLYDGESYGGTRAMPVPILAQAALIHVFGDTAKAGKVLSLIAFAALVLLFWFSLAASHVSASIRLGLLGAAIFAGPLWLNVLGVRYDTLPVVLQVAALLVISRLHGARPRLSVVLAALLCALAVFCKLSAVWGAVALFIWLALNHRRQLVLYVAVGTVTGVALAVAFNVASSGRFAENLLELGFAGVDSDRGGPFGFFVGLLKGGKRAISQLVQSSPSLLVVVPFGMLAVIRWRPPVRLDVYQIAILTCCASMLIVFADLGARDNHLVAPTVLMLLVVGRAFTSRPSSAVVGPDPGPESRGLLLVALMIAIGVGAVSRDLHKRLERIRWSDDAPVERQTKRSALLALTEGKTRILSEDPWACIVRGEHPVILDAFMLLRLDRARPDLVDPLIQRIEERTFDAIVLRRRLASPGERAWYAQVHFGERVASAIEAAYRPAGSAAGTGRTLYLPKDE